MTACLLCQLRPPASHVDSAVVVAMYDPLTQGEADEVACECPWAEVAMLPACAQRISVIDWLTCPPVSRGERDHVADLPRDAVPFVAR